MPTVYRQEGFRFFFYSNEHPPPHMHVSKAGGELRFILGSESEEPTLDKELSPMKKKDARRAFDIVKEQQKFLLKKWGEKYEEQNI
jgi:hypothetical protein